MHGVPMEVDTRVKRDGMRRGRGKLALKDTDSFDVGIFVRTALFEDGGELLPENWVTPYHRRARCYARSVPRRMKFAMG